jgi:hypothetical protein
MVNKIEKQIKLNNDKYHVSFKVKDFDCLSFLAYSKNDLLIGVGGSRQSI